MLFNTAVIDPPWPIPMAGQFKRFHRARTLPYKTMPLGDIKALPIASHLAPGAHVYLWATNATLRSAFDVLAAWGIRFHQVLVMTKPSGMAPALGYIFGTEFCLLGFAGSRAGQFAFDGSMVRARRPMQPFRSIGALNWFMRPSGQHSVKPDSFYGIVERMSPGPYGDFFARRPREGWAVWGDEVVSDFQLGSY